MAYKEIFWMTCDSTEQLRAEYGPFHTRAEAETEAQKLGFGYLLRYEHILGDHEEVQEVRCIFVELPGAIPVGVEPVQITLHTRCATCGESSAHNKSWEAEVWADIHEFEHSRHRVRLRTRPRQRPEGNRRLARIDQRAVAAKTDLRSFQEVHHKLPDLFRDIASEQLVLFRF